jgi:hypothetical protein
VLSTVIVVGKNFAPNAATAPDELNFPTNQLELVNFALYNRE